MTYEDRLAWVDHAIINLRAARDGLVKAGSKRAAAKVRLALSSALGARRHVQNAEVREARHAA